MSGVLKKRLRSHEESFNGLLSLIPAKLYYGEDVSDQWKRKKQTPEQKRAAKMAKLDPANWKSAKDVMEERSAAAKRKRDEEQSNDLGEETRGIEPEQPKFLQDQEHQNVKRLKVDDNLLPSNQGRALNIDENEEKKAAKKATKAERSQKEKEKLQMKKARQVQERADKAQQAKIEKDGSKIAEPIVQDQRIGDNLKDVDQWSTASSSQGASDVLSPPPVASGVSSSSSVPSLADQSTEPMSYVTDETTSQTAAKPQVPPQLSISDREAARARLASVISSFRTARKADEPNPNKARNRAELLEQRRRKEEAKRAAKLEQRRKEKAEATRIEDEEIARRFSPGGSGSLLASPRSPPIKGSGGPGTENNFSYGRIEFKDGANIDTNTPNGAQVQDVRKRKGPQGAQGALIAAQNKAARLAGLDKETLEEIASKDMWLTAKRRAHGERVKDDTNLLKKALKRQESQKKKSEKEWADRKEGIRAAQDSRQKKRTENLAKRKEEKLERKMGKKSGKKLKKRPGFEGSFRGRTSSGSGKKK